MVAGRQLPVIQAGQALDAGSAHGPAGEHERALSSSRIAAPAVPFEPPSPATVK
jgi:hypothetical protein